MLFWGGKNLEQVSSMRAAHSSIGTASHDYLTYTDVHVCRVLEALCQVGGVREGSQVSSDCHGRFMAHPYPETLPLVRTCILLFFIILNMPRQCVGLTQYLFATHPIMLFEACCMFKASSAPCSL